MRLQLQSKKFGTLTFVIQHFNKFDNRVIEARGYVEVNGEKVFASVQYVKSLKMQAILANHKHNEFLGFSQDTDVCFALPEGWEEKLISMYMNRFDPAKITLKFYNGDTHHNIGFWSNGVQVADVVIGETPSRKNITLGEIENKVERMWWKGQLPFSPEQEKKSTESGSYVSDLHFTMEQLQSLVPVIFASDFAEAEKKEAALKQVAQTGQRVLISKEFAATEEVSPREAEESTWSDVLTWANPDGTITTEFSHHY
jgi:hypothetical protein